jgi:hypothetical protein
MPRRSGSEGRGWRRRRLLTRPARRDRAPLGLCQFGGRCQAVASGGGSVPGLNPLVLASWSVGRENGGQVDVGATHVSRVPESGWTLPLSARIRRPDGGKTP